MTIAGVVGQKAEKHSGQVNMLDCKLAVIFTFTDSNVERFMKSGSVLNGQEQSVRHSQ